MEREGGGGERHSARREIHRDRQKGIGRWGRQMKGKQPRRCETSEREAGPLTRVRRGPKYWAGGRRCRPPRPGQGCGGDRCQTLGRGGSRPARAAHAPYTPAAYATALALAADRSAARSPRRSPPRHRSSARGRLSAMRRSAARGRCAGDGCSQAAEAPTCGERLRTREQLGTQCPSIRLRQTKP